MKYRSTRHRAPECSVSEAMLKGLAPDGGLYVPSSFPQFNMEQLNTASFHTFAADLLKPLFKNDPLENQLEQICAQAFNFEIPLKTLDDRTHVLELFHGPTLAFKDIGARFLAECLNRVSEKKKLTLLVATSGDTGSAVASAFYNKMNIHVVILYPKGKISERQEKQIVCWDKNILPLAVEGRFDDCQTLVKSAFQDEWWTANSTLTTANSINIGRLLPQLVYYAYTSVQYKYKTEMNASFIVPSGNVGNVTAAFWAKQMGFPIAEITIATNANETLTEYLSTGEYHPRKSIETLANAMDVGNPSNIERLRDLFVTENAMCALVNGFKVTDNEIKQTIKDIWELNHYAICPHTATAFATHKQLNAQLYKPNIIVGTADPSKFETVVEPIIGSALEIKPRLKKMISTTQKAETIPPKLSDVQLKFEQSFLSEKV